MTSPTSEDSRTRVVITVHGTCGREDKWFQASNPLWRRIPRSVVHPFVWCGQVDGVIGADNCWTFGGTVLAQVIQSYADSIPRPHITVVAHSHGGNVVARASKFLAAKTIDLLVTVSTPNRKSMRPAYQSTNVATTHWLHCYGDWYRDWITSLGRLGTKWTPSTNRTMIWADHNERMYGHGHTSMLYSPLFYDYLAQYIAGDPTPWQALNLQFKK